MFGLLGVYAMYGFVEYLNPDGFGFLGILVALWLLAVGVVSFMIIWKTTRNYLTRKKKHSKGHAGR